MKEGGGLFICAGEHSGDLLAADLALALRACAPRLPMYGVTGAAMQQAGVETLASVDRLAVMGIWEVAVKLADIRMLERQLLMAVDRRRPIAAVLVDFPGFHLRLAEQLRLRGIPVYQYIAPKVWAWGEGRLAQLRRDFALILGVFPFEEGYFQKHGVPYTYVGSPHLDRTAKVKVRRQDLGFSSTRPLFAFLPGSRLSEIKKILPVIAATKAAIKRRLPDAQFVVPVAPNLDQEHVTALLTSFDSQAKSDFILTSGMSLEVMAVADVACVASGTATLECALLGTPMVVVYVMNEMSYFIAKRKVRLPYVSLVNILLGKRAVPEFIQHFSTAAVADDMLALLEDKHQRQEALEHFAELKALLSGGAAGNAAEAILASLATGRRPPIEA